MSQTIALDPAPRASTQLRVSRVPGMDQPHLVLEFNASDRSLPLSRGQAVQFVQFVASPWEVIGIPSEFRRVRFVNASGHQPRLVTALAAQWKPAGSCGRSLLPALLKES